MAGVLIPGPWGSYLNLGDVASAHGDEAGLWKALGSPAGVSILKLSHHGSRGSSDPRWLKHLAPRQVWISAGFANRYGHPHGRVLQDLGRRGVPWVGTWERGGIQLP